MKIFSTSSVVSLASKLNGHIPTSLEIFNSSEIKITVPQETEDSYSIICSIVSMNDYMELLLLLDSLRTYKSLNLIILYMFYARQDQDYFLESCGGRLFQQMIEKFENIKCIYHLDLHCNFFSIKNQSFSCEQLFIADIKKNAIQNPLIVAPDEKAQEKAMNLAKALDTDYLFCEKERAGERLKITGDFSKVKGRNCILVDDIIDTGKTIVYTALELNKNHAKSVIAYCTHGVFSQELKKSCVKEIVVTDSICKLVPNSENVRSISILPLLKELIDGML